MTKLAISSNGYHKTTWDAFQSFIAPPRVGLAPSLTNSVIRSIRATGQTIPTPIENSVSTICEFLSS